MQHSSRFATMKVICSALLTLAILLVNSARSEVITLDDALSTALHKTARGEMIGANLDVAEQNYFARRINFYLPEISINGKIPAYSVDQSYRFFGGATQKSLAKTRNVDFNSFIEMRQSLITGGDVVVTANLTASNERYPVTREGTLANLFIDEKTREGFFTFSYSQPLLKPSDSKNRYRDSKDDYYIAQLQRSEDETALKKEIVEAYVGVLQQDLKAERMANQFGALSFKANVDSLKLVDGVISEEDWLLSASERLDAELDSVQAETESAQKKRDLKNLLEWNIGKPIELKIPEVQPHTRMATQTMLANWESSIPVQKAELEYLKAKRTAEFAASGHGLTGDLTANYSTGQGNVTTDGFKNDINTRGWGVSLNFSYPLWDGGASGAAVKSAEIQSEQARLDYETIRKSVEAEITNLVNQLDVSYRRLEIVSKQIELAQNRYKIAESRYNNGEISDAELLESKVVYLDTQDKYLEELKSYLLNRIELEGKYSDLQS